MKAQLQQANGAWQLRRGKIIRKHGIGTRCMGGASRAYEHAAAEQLLEALRQPTQSGDPADCGDSTRQHDFPGVYINKPRHRDTDENVEDDVSRAD